MMNFNCLINENFHGFFYLELQSEVHQQKFKNFYANEILLKMKS